MIWFRLDEADRYVPKVATDRPPEIPSQSSGEKNEGFFVLLRGLQVEPAPGAWDDLPVCRSRWLGVGRPHLWINEATLYTIRPTCGFDGSSAVIVKFTLRWARRRPGRLVLLRRGPGRRCRLW